MRPSTKITLIPCIFVFVSHVTGGSYSVIKIITRLAKVQICHLNIFFVVPKEEKKPGGSKKEMAREFHVSRNTAN